MSCSLRLLHCTFPNPRHHQTQPFARAVSYCVTVDHIIHVPSQQLSLFKMIWLVWICLFIMSSPLECKCTSECLILCTPQHPAQCLTHSSRSIKYLLNACTTIVSKSVELKGKKITLSVLPVITVLSLFCRLEAASQRQRVWRQTVLCGNHGSRGLPNLLLRALSPCLTAGQWNIGLKVLVQSTRWLVPGQPLFSEILTCSRWEA